MVRLVLVLVLEMPVARLMACTEADAKGGGLTNRQHAICARIRFFTF
ncbi:hypothetical protein SABR111722_21125 [Saccharibacillus brassicae]